MDGRRGRARPRAPGAVPRGGLSFEEQSANLWMGGCWLMGLRNSCGLVSPLTCHNDILNTFFLLAAINFVAGSPRHTTRSDTAHGMYCTYVRLPSQSVHGEGVHRASYQYARARRRGQGTVRARHGPHARAPRPPLPPWPRATRPSTSNSRTPIPAAPTAQAML